MAAFSTAKQNNGCTAKRKQQQTAKALSKMPFKSNKPFNLYKQTIAAKQILAWTDFLFYFFVDALKKKKNNKRRFYKYMTNGYGVQ